MNSVNGYTTVECVNKSCTWRDGRVKMRSVHIVFAALHAEISHDSYTRLVISLHMSAVQSDLNFDT